MKKGYIAYFSMHVRETACLISTFDLKSDVTVVFLDPIFLYDAAITVIREHFRQLTYLFCMDFKDLLAQTGGFWGRGK